MDTSAYHGRYIQWRSKKCPHKLITHVILLWDIAKLFHIKVSYRTLAYKVVYKNYMCVRLHEEKKQYLYLK